MALDPAAAAALRENGFCVVPDALSPRDLARARDALDRAVAAMENAGEPTFNPRQDYNEANIRVYGLAGKDPLFADLLARPVAMQFTDHLIGPSAVVAEFSANIALPGSLPMKWHSDQALVESAPWERCRALNVIWCLDDMDVENGATKYVPGSHRARTMADLPADLEAAAVPFEARAGTIVAMEGRLWHTSGANVSRDRRRRLMFAYYVDPTMRPSVDWETFIKPD